MGGGGGCMLGGCVGIRCSGVCVGPTCVHRVQCDALL